MARPALLVLQQVKVIKEGIPKVFDEMFKKPFEKRRPIRLKINLSNP